MRRCKLPRHIIVSISIAALTAGLCAMYAAAAGMPAVAGRSGITGMTALEGTVDPDTYVLGVGDALAIGFWGEVNRHEVVSVNPDGYVLIVPVGPIKVDGLTLTEAREIIRDKLSPYYTPTILSVSLVSIRIFQVHVVGMVQMPGAYEANALTRVSQIVARAGTLHVEASSRNIEIRRDKDAVRADLMRYLLLGDNTANPFLRDGDVVHVPPRRGMVHIFGSVHRPGDYEFTEGEDLAELIELAGGFTPDAITDSLEIQRFSVDDPTEWTRFMIDGDPSTLAAFELQLDDHAFIRGLPDWHEDAHVQIYGEVRYPGRYAVNEGVELLSHVIERAGGFTEDASLAEAVLIRGLYAGRETPSESELEALVEAQEQLDYKEKDLFKTLMREPKGAASMSIANLYAGGEDFLDPPVYNGDFVQVPKSTNMVRVSGQVHNPGLIPYEEGQYAGYYIREAGGYASRADKRGARVIRGHWGQMLKSGDTTVRPGDIIWVPAKKERDGWETFRDVVWVFAQIATVFLVIDAATKSN